MGYFIGGLLVWIFCGLVTLFSLAMPLKTGHSWDFKFPIWVVVISIIFGPLSQISSKVADNELIVKLLSK